MDLFDAPLGSCLAHACNARGVWGAGVALGFARRFPEARKMYERLCRAHTQNCCGIAFVIADDKYEIGCLITSADYGDKRDTPEQILKATEYAIGDLNDLLPAGVDVYMPKINSGLFGVPWEDTMQVLLANCSVDRNWIICTPRAR